MGESEAIFINGAYIYIYIYIYVNEIQMYIFVYRYPPCYPKLSTLLLNVMYFLRYCEICIDDRNL